MEPVAEAKRPVPDDAMLQRFLLGQLSGSDREALESQFFDDAECFERLLVLEESLIEAYVLQHLRKEDRDCFEARYLATPVGRQCIALTRAAREPRAQSRPAVLIADLIACAAAAFAWLRVDRRRLRMAVAAASFAVIAGTVWVWNYDRLLRRQLLEATISLAQHQQTEQDLRSQIDDARRRAEQLARQTAPEGPPGAVVGKPSISPAAAGPIVSLTLLPGLTRDSLEQAAVLQLPRNASLAVLQLDLSSTQSYGSYRAVLRTVDDAQLWQQDLSAPWPFSTREPLVVSIPARILESGEYLLTLRGIARDRRPEDLATYYFRVMQ